MLRLAPGPLVVMGRGPTYERTGRSVIVHMSKGVAKCVEFVLRPSSASPDAGYPRLTEIVQGADPYSRESVLELIGEPQSTQRHQKDTMRSDVYRIGRQRVLFYWVTDGMTPMRVVVGRKV